MLTNYWQKWTAEIDGAVQAGFIEGQSMSQISNIIYDSISVSKTGTTKKVGDKAWRSAKTMARMGVNHYANTARIAFAQDNTDIITGMTIISVIDSSTSQKCRGLDGEVIKLDDPKLNSFICPLHRGCRSANGFDVDERYKLDKDKTDRASSFEVDGKRDPKPVSSEGIYYDKMA